MNKHHIRWFYLLYEFKDWVYVDYLLLFVSLLCSRNLLTIQNYLPKNRNKSSKPYLPRMLNRISIRLNYSSIITIQSSNPSCSNIPSMLLDLPLYFKLGKLSVKLWMEKDKVQLLICFMKLFWSILELMDSIY